MQQRCTVKISSWKTSSNGNFMQIKKDLDGICKRLYCVGIGSGEPQCDQWCSSQLMNQWKWGRQAILSAWHQCSECPSVQRPFWLGERRHKNRLWLSQRFFWRTRPKLEAVSQLEFNIPFQHNYGLSETKGQGWRVILNQWRKASDILTSTLAAFLFSSHPKREKDRQAHLNNYCTTRQKVNRIQQKNKHASLTKKYI